MSSVDSTLHAWRKRGGGRVRRWVVAGFATMLLAPSAGLATTVASSPLGDPDVVAHWNQIAQATLLGDTTKKPQEHFLYLSFLNIAIYDAVVGIHGRYQSYGTHTDAPAGASDEAAVAAAAHHVLETYSSYAQGTLDTAYAASLAAIPDGQAKTDGIAYGTLTASNLIALRVNDGRNANITFDLTAAPGVWRPTPSANLAMFVPWMGAVKPLVIRSGAQFGEPGPPPAMTSKQYTTDFNEVARMGGNVATGSDRTADQTATALFFSGNAQVQYTGALIDQANVRNLDIVDTARMFAAVNTSQADALIAIWHAKLHYGFWRPITAINLADTDGN
ncbi:MAG: vanadium-dependent haloperoxidase, partial [Chloroflexota bacterium]